MRRSRNNHSAQEKASILRECLIDKVAISNLCDKRGIHLMTFYRWQKSLLEICIGCLSAGAAHQPPSFSGKRCCSRKSCPAKT